MIRDVSNEAWSNCPYQVWISISSRMNDAICIINSIWHLSYGEYYALNMCVCEYNAFILIFNRWQWRKTTTSSIFLHAIAGEHKFHMKPNVGQQSKWIPSAYIHFILALISFACLEKFFIDEMHLSKSFVKKNTHLELMFTRYYDDRE